MTRARTVASAAPEAFKALRPHSGASAARNAAHEPRGSTDARSRRFTSTATAVQRRDHALDLVVRGEASRQDGPSPRENPAVNAGRIAQHREVSTTSASSTGQHGARVIVEAAQHATTSGAHRVTAGPRGCRGDAASATVGAEYIAATRPGGLDGQSGWWVAQLARVLGRSLDRSRADTPGFFTKSVRVFGLHGDVTR